MKLSNYFHKKEKSLNSFTAINQIVSITREQFEKSCRANVHSVYIGNHVQLCKILTKYKMYVDARDIGIAPHLILEGFWEAWITKWMASIIKLGDVCLDIGANFGYYSLLLAELSGTSGRTLAIEPNPRICDLLRKTSIVNEYHFEVIEGAASNKNGHAKLIVEDKYFGGGTIMQLDELFPERSRVTVETFILDDMLDKLNCPKVDFIKMDCEGFEPFVLEGMQRTLRNNPDIKIAMEYSPYMYEDAEGFTKKLFLQFEVSRISVNSTLESFTVNDLNYLLAFKAPVDLFLRQFE